MAPSQDGEIIRRYRPDRNDRVRGCLARNTSNEHDDEFSWPIYTFMRPSYMECTFLPLPLYFSSSSLFLLIISRSFSRNIPLVFKIQFWKWSSIRSGVQRCWFIEPASKR